MPDKEWARSAHLGACARAQEVVGCLVIRGKCRSYVAMPHSRSLGRHTLGALEVEWSGSDNN
eukprot:360937-Chlamydomonas_euryale.AAC.2